MFEQHNINTIECSHIHPRKRQNSLSLSNCSFSRPSFGSKQLSYQTPINQSTQNLLRSKNHSQIRSCSRSKCVSQTKSNDNFKPIKTSQIYMKKLLEKMFNKSLQLMNAGQLLTQHNIIDVFSYLGLFSDPPTKRDLDAAKKIICILDKRSKGVKRQNLLKLIWIISKVPIQLEKTQATDNPSSGLRRDTQQQLNSESQIQIGWFTNQGTWVTTEYEQKQIRDILGHLYFNKISNQNVKYIRSPSIQQCTFKPKILDKSGHLSLKYRKKLTQNPNQKSAEDLLMLHGELHRSKVQQTKKLIQNKQLQPCTFKPKINKSSVSSNKHLLSKPRIQIKQLTSKQIKQQNQLKQCSFRPKTIKLKQNNQHIPVRNELKIVNRMKQAYNKRVITNTMKQRGYPKEVNWSEYMFNSKKGKKEKKPILSVDIKIANQVQLLNIYQGESVQSIACKILVKNKLPYDYQQSLQLRLKQMLNDSLVVRVQDGFIYSK